MLRMGTLTRYQSSSARLLQRILERPELTAAVPALPVPVLATLIDRIGLEDAGEIVALASPAQLERVLDHDVWRAEAPGADETFAPERFALWLGVLLEAGEEAVAARLRELPRDTLVLALHHLMLVLDRDSLIASRGAFDDALRYESFEEYHLFARDPDAWDVVWTCLLALDRDDHELVRSLLARCCALDCDLHEYADERDLHELLGADEMLASDVAAAREERRGAAGFVGAADARAFLELARSGGDVGERDAIASAYFRGLESARAEAADSGSDSDSDSGSDSARTRSAISIVSKPDLAALVELVRGDDLATRDAERTAQGTTLLDAAMNALGARDPRAFGARMEELGFLANVLIAAGAHAGRAPRPIEALEAAIAVCNLGLERALPPPRTLDAATRALGAISADALFRTGYPELHAEVIAPARALLAERGDAPAHPELLALGEIAPWFAATLARPGRRPFIADAADVRGARAFLARLAADPTPDP
jgi:hypothetical protein